jgi:hypothetical protein
MGLGEKADGYSGGGWHRFIKRYKARIERRKAKRALKKGEQPVATYGKYKGWEL